MKTMKPYKTSLRRAVLAILCAAVVLPFFAAAPEASAQVSFNVQIGTPPPVCPYGYYDYAPYACAPMGFYGPGYFYHGIFLGVGPWAYWGYGHGWGPHRFYAPGGGRYFYYPDRRPWGHDRDWYYRHGWQNDNHGWHHGNAYGHDHDNHGHAYGHYDHGDRDHGDHGHGDHADHGHGDHGHGHDHDH